MVRDLNTVLGRLNSKGIKVAKRPLAQQNPKSRGFKERGLENKVLCAPQMTFSLLEPLCSHSRIKHR